MPIKCWEIIADKLCKAGWSLGWVSAVDSEGRTIWIVDAHRDDGKRSIARSDEKLTAFLELEAVVRNDHQDGNVNRHQLDVAVGETTHPTLMLA